MANGAHFTQTYSIPDKGYEIGYSLKQKGLDSELNSENLIFQWTDEIKPTRKRSGRHTEQYLSNLLHGRWRF
jgi:hypothetical protein